MSTPLNPRQAKFVELYLAGHSATEAYVKAGYKATRASAETNAARLLGNDRVKEAVDAARKKAAKAQDMSAEWFAARVRLEAEREGVGSSHAGRVAALKLAGQFLGCLAEKHELSGPNGGPIQTNGEHEHRVCPTPSAGVVAAVLRDLGLPVPGDLPADGL